MNSSFRFNQTDFQVSTEGKGWDCSMESKTPEEGVELHTFRFHSRCGKSRPSPVELVFQIPCSDCQVKWQPAGQLAECHHFLPPWWRRSDSSATIGAPLASYFNLAGMNRLTLALSEARYAVKAAIGPNFDALQQRFLVYDGTEGEEEEFAFTLRLDRREIFYADALRDLTAWYEGHFPPAPVPTEAYRPLYSTWYQYQKGVHAVELQAELPFIKALPLSGIILDDGWQCSRTTGGGLDMTTCGDWEPCPSKFPDMKSHVAEFRKEGLKYLLWIALPFAGRASRACERFRGKFLNHQERPCNTLDPRYPEVRRYLLDQLEKLVTTYDLDGLKIDFIDSFFQPEEGLDPAAAHGFEGCDFRNVFEAVEELLGTATVRLREIKPNLLIEFRQKYTGPAMRRHGNIFRAADCAYDLLENRVRTIDLRLLAGQTAVHSDMITWTPDDTIEDAALQLQSVLFAVPQISLRLSKLQEGHRRMLRFWLEFFEAHQGALLLGKLRPEHPELSYPVVTAIGKCEVITALYEEGKTLCCPVPPDKPWIIVNATHGDVIYPVLPSGSFLVEVFDVFGAPWKSSRHDGGIAPIRIPSAGFVQITRHGSGSASPEDIG